MAGSTPAEQQGPATAKGRARRAALAEAAAALLFEQGPGAVTARAVAARAGVPLAATTYYFDDTSALLSEAASAVADRHIEAARVVIADGRAADDADDAAFLLRVVTGGVEDAEGLVALYERALASCRTPALATALSGFDRRVHEVVVEALEACGRRADRARSVLALADGALVGALLAATPAPMSAARDVMAQVLDSVAPPAAARATGRRPAGRSRRRAERL